MSTSLVRFTTRIETALHAEMKHYAIDKGLKLERVFNQAVKDFLAKKRRIGRAA